MKLVFISDTHTQLDKIAIPDGDVLIHCGDALSYGTSQEFWQFCQQMHGIAKRFKLVLYSPGNHDLIVEREPGRCREAFNTRNCQMLLHEPFEFEGVKFFGSPYTPMFFNWAFMYPREDARRIWLSIPNDTDVLFTHGMPYGILDKTGRLVGAETDFHAGCPVLMDRILQIRPKVYAGGHLHLQGGRTDVDTIDGTTFVNAAMCDDQYKPTRKPIVIEYEKEHKQNRRLATGDSGSLSQAGRHVDILHG